MLQERWLAVALLALPIIAFVAVKAAHGGFVERYVLPAVLGMPLAFAYSLRFFGRKATPLFALFVLTMVLLQEGFFWTSESRAFGHFINPADSVEHLVASANPSPGLPIVISDGHDYLEDSHYASPDWSRRFVALVDPAQAVVYSGSDSLDRQLFALQCCVAIQVYRFNDFAPGHPKFLLYSGGHDWDWWAYRLLHDGYSLQLLAAQGNERLYSASAPAKMP